MAVFLLDDDVIPLNPSTLSTELASYYVLVTNLAAKKSYKEGEILDEWIKK